MNINIKRVLTDISTSLIPRLRSDLKPYGLDVDWQINSGIVTINVNEKGKNLTFAIIDIASNYYDFNYSELNKNSKYKGAERIIKDFVLDVKLIKYLPKLEMALNKLYLVPLINEDYQITIKNVLDFGATVRVIDLRKGIIDLQKGYAKLSINDVITMNEAVENFINKIGLVYDKEQ
jgi:hypothetical protein|nr:MAG TPA: hypothetical protein [Caudoviricetes sp.]